MQESFTRLSNYLPKNKQDEIMNEIANSRGQWEAINVRSAEILNKLRATTHRWDLLLETKNRLNDWLQEKEAILQSFPKGNGEISEMKTILERLRYMDSEISQRSSEFDEVTSELEFFEPLSVPEEDKIKLQTLVERFSTLKANCADRTQEYEIEIGDYTAYQYQLQEIEKWLLQISFQLMAHNSLYISNYNQTKEQIAQHETLLECIQKYQANIDDLNAKGQQQVNRYEPFSSTVRGKIEGQVNNIQESYNSLLNTSIQIKNRLYDSLNKFKEYEDTLDSIMANLDGYETTIDVEMQKPIETLNDSKAQLKLMQNLQDKLQQERQRLMIAVQACDAATASISRPSSPIFNQNSTIPEKELLVRAKLDDLTDKLLPCIDLLIEKVKGFDEILTKRDELNDWIEQQTALANEIDAKTLRLRFDSAAPDLSVINDILQEINSKRNIILTEFMNQLPDNEIADLEKSIDDLESQLMNIAEQKRAKQSSVDDYLKSVKNLKNFFDKLTQRLEVIDGSGGLNCAQKLNEIDTIKKEYESEVPKLMDEITIKDDSKLFVIISNFDAQQVDDNLKINQRRDNDFRKRIERKIQLLNLAAKNLDKLQGEIDQTKFFFDDNIEKISKPFVLGYLVKPIEGYLQYLKNLTKDIENKQAFIDSLNKKNTSMHSELDVGEQQKIKNQISELQKSEKKLMDIVKSEIARAQQGLAKAKDVEIQFDTIRSWIDSEKAHNEDKKNLIISFAPSAVDTEIQACRKRLQNIKDFSDNVLNGTIEKVTDIKEQCGESGKHDLQNTVDGFSADVETMALTCNNQLQNIESIVRRKKEYEQDSEALLNWIKETHQVMATNVKTSSVQILEEQMRKYEGLLKEADSKKYVLKAIQDKADSIMNNLSEADRLNLTCQVKNLEDKFNLLVIKLNERYNNIVDNIKQLKESQKQIAEYTQFILSIQLAIKELNKPIGSKTEDVQGLLKEYENILNRLKAKKAEMSMQKISSLPQIKELLSTHDDIIDAIENQLRRLKQLLALREQYIALVNEVINFNVKYTDIVAHVEKSEDKIENKIKQYDKIMMKIQECEGVLASANDKGMQIASEGTVEDRNNIIEQLQTLKNQLLNLKQSVENLRQKHEKTVNLHKNLESNIVKTINSLLEKEGRVKILPLLDVDTESVDQEIKKHDALAADIQKGLIKLQATLDGMDKSENTLPPHLADKVSTGRSLLQSLPVLLADRRNYLDTNKQNRLDYIKLVADFNNWINLVENDFINDNNGIDFQNIAAIIEKHTKSVDSKLPDIKRLLEQINASSKNIMPSLNNINKEEHMRVVQKFSDTLKDIVARAQQIKVNLNENNDKWKQYCSLYASIESLLKKVPKDTALSSIDKLNDYLNKLNAKLQAIQVSTFFKY